MADAPGLPSLGFQLSAGPAVSGGNPASGGATDGTFTPLFGGRQTAAQSLVSTAPLILGGIALWLLMHRRT